RAQHHLTAAADYCQSALTMREKRAPDSLEVANSLNNLGTVAIDRQDLVAATHCFQRALAIQESFASASPNLALTLHNLGVVAQRQGRWIEAERRARQAWAL